MTHKAKDCLERPRARGAKLTGKHIAADEAAGSGAPGASTGGGGDPAAALTSYAARRDRWRGYDPAEYDKVVDLYDKVEAAKREMVKAAELAARFGAGRQQGKGRAGRGGGGDREGGDEGGSSSSGEEEDEEEDGGGGAAATAAAAAAAAAAAGAGTAAPGGGDEDKVGDTASAAFAAVEKRVRTPGGGASGSVRNLRIREDTAKYLLNLDTESAYYDPKSRSMRQDPRPDLPAAAKAFAGDNFVRTAGGEYAAWAALEAHASAAAAAGADGVHATAVPSQAAALHAAFRARKAALDSAAGVSVKARYGNAAAAPDPSLAPLLTGQTEAYTEYDPATGRALPGKGRGVAANAPARSRYEEDVHPGNHTAAWGSWWAGGVWGYACCHATLRGAHCLGAAGREAAQAAAEQMVANLEAAAGRRSAAAAAALAAGVEAAGSAGGAPAPPQQQRPPGSAAAWGPDAAGGAGAGGEAALDPSALAAALQAEDERIAAGGKGKRPLGEGAAAPTAEEMEAFRLKRARAEDPMARAKDGGEKQGGYEFV